MSYPKPVALCDAIKNVVEDLQSLDLAIQEAFHFVLEEDDPQAANDPEHRKHERIALPDWVLFNRPDGSRPKPHENFLMRINSVIDEEFDGSMNAFANAIGYSQKTLWVWLSEKSPSRNPTVFNIYEVCDLLGWDYFEAMSPLGSLDRRIQDAGNFILEKDEAAPANDPEHETEAVVFESTTEEKPSPAWLYKREMEHYLANFRKHCKAELQRRDESENAFAHRIKISQKTVWKTLNGHFTCSPRFDTMLKLAQGLDLDLFEILQD